MTSSTDTDEAGRSRPITKDDLRAKFSELQGSTEDQVDQARSVVAMGALAAVGVLVIAAFVLGRRRGRKRRTVVEIKRI